MQKRLVGQAVKTSASHAENMGSIPVRVTIKKETDIPCGCLFLFCLCSAQNRTHLRYHWSLFFLAPICARGSHTALGGILRYSSCRPTNSRFPYLFAARILLCAGRSVWSELTVHLLAWQYTAPAVCTWKYQEDWVVRPSRCPFFLFFGDPYAHRPRRTYQP